jgi:hypothetical protein
VSGDDQTDVEHGGVDQGGEYLAVVGHDDRPAGVAGQDAGPPYRGRVAPKT